MDKVPVSLIIDDAGPVNMSHFHQLGVWHELLVPPVFLRNFAKICQAYGIRGKFSVVPMPAGLGRIDGKINQVPTRNITEYRKVIKRDIEPLFSITPEILTHYLAYNLQNPLRRQHVMEDVYFSNLEAEQIAEYVGFALQILVNAGLTPTGVTSPWKCGIDNEQNYAKGIGLAYRKVMNATSCFYFLHSRDELKKPTLMVDTPETGQVISIPANTHDAFWYTQNPATQYKAVQSVKKNLDKLLTTDGKNGTIRQLFEQQLPITLITHWQSLFSDGRCLGLEGLKELAMRINKTFGNKVEWMCFEKLAKSWKY